VEVVAAGVVAAEVAAALLDRTGNGPVRRQQ